jgi:hypothetical protein
MGIDECIDVYNEIMSSTFDVAGGLLETGSVDPYINSRNLKIAINMVLGRSGMSETELLNDGVTRCCRT